MSKQNKEQRKQELMNQIMQLRDRKEQLEGQLQQVKTQEKIMIGRLREVQENLDSEGEKQENESLSD